MELKEKLRIEIKKTVGYSETKDKDVFMIGADVALEKSINHFQDEISHLKRLNESYDKAYQEVSKDMSTLARIIKRYT